VFVLHTRISSLLENLEKESEKEEILHLFSISGATYKM